MGGTFGSLRKKQRQREEQIRKAEFEALKREELRKNREEVIAEICKLFGWSKLDDFAQKMIDDAFAGQVVDIEKLKKDIADWKKAQEKTEEE